MGRVLLRVFRFSPVIIPREVTFFQKAENTKKKNDSTSVVLIFKSFQGILSSLMIRNVRLMLCHTFRQRFVAVRSGASICPRSVAGIAGSNPADGMDIRLLCLLCVV